MTYAVTTVRTLEQDTSFFPVLTEAQDNFYDKVALMMDSMGSNVKRVLLQQAPTANGPWEVVNEVRYTKQGELQS